MIAFILLLRYILAIWSA